MSTIKAKNIKQTVIGTTIQPLKIGGILEDGSDAKLTISTDGSASFQGNVETSDSLKLIANYSLSSQATSFTIGGLNLVKGALYKVSLTSSIAQTGGQVTVRLYVNGDTTASNYFSSMLEQVDALGSGAYSDNPVGGGIAGYETLSEIFIRIMENGRVAFISENLQLRTSFLESLRFHGIYSIPVTSITSLTFSHTIANGFTTPTKVHIARVM